MQASQWILKFLDLTERSSVGTSDLRKPGKMPMYFSFTRAPWQIWNFPRLALRHTIWHIWEEQLLDKRKSIHTKREKEKTNEERQIDDNDDYYLYWTAVRALLRNNFESYWRQINAMLWWLIPTLKYGSSIDEKLADWLGNTWNVIFMADRKII